MRVVLWFLETDRSLTGRGMVLTPQSHAYSYFTGAICVRGSNIIVKGEAIFANNSAGFGGTTSVKLSRVF